MRQDWRAILAPTEAERACREATQQNPRAYRETAQTAHYVVIGVRLRSHRPT